MKNIYKIIIPILLLILCWAGLNKILTLKSPEYMMMDTFYNDSSSKLADVLCIGSSHAYTSCNTEVFWNEFGIPVYCLSSPSQPLGISYYYLKEALRYCKPKVVLLEGFYINWAWSEYDYALGVASCSLKNSFNKFAIALNAPYSLKLNLLSNVIFYHTRGLSVSQYDFDYAFGNKRHNTHGFNPWWSYEKFNDSITKYDTQLKVKPDDLAIQYMEKFINLCEDNQVIPIVYISPHNIAEQQYKYNNWWKEYFAEKKIDFIDGMQLVDDLNINPEVDNVAVHISYYGSKKLSSYIGGYLIEKGYIKQDRRKEKQYEKWSADADYYCKYEEQFNLENCPSEFFTYISKVMDMDNLFLLITYTGNTDSNNYDFNSIKSLLIKQGVSIDLNSYNPFIGIYYNNQCLYESQQNVNIFECSPFHDLKQIYIMNNRESENMIIDYKRLSAVNEKRDFGIKTYVYSKDLGRCIDVRVFSLCDIISQINNIAD